MMSVIGSLLIGLVVGFIARAVKPGDDKLGWIMTAVLGVAGSFLANYVGQALGWYQAGETAGFLASVVGAVVLLFVYGMSGLLSGLGGVMSASRLYSANGNLGVGYELDAIAAVILGGTSFVGGIGTITGTLVGALIIATLNNGMTLMGVSYFWQLVIKGAVIIIAVLIDKYRTRHHQSA